MTEPQITTKIVMKLNSEPYCYAKKRHSGKFQSGEPDITGCFNGQAFYIETKMLNGTLTKLQAHQLELWRSSGAQTFVAIYDPEEKELEIIRPDDHDSWEEIADDKEAVKELWSLITSEKAKLKDFNFGRWFVYNFDPK